MTDTGSPSSNHHHHLSSSVLGVGEMVCQAYYGLMDDFVRSEKPSLLIAERRIPSYMLLCITVKVFPRVFYIGKVQACARCLEKSHKTVYQVEFCAS